MLARGWPAVRPHPDPMTPRWKAPVSRQLPGSPVPDRPSATMPLRSRTVRLAPSWSDLFTTRMSAISKMPALAAWIPSPIPGAKATTTVSASRNTAISFCPTPTVSTSTSSNPIAENRSAAAGAAADSPPSSPRLDIDRMNTPLSVLCSPIRTRSPSNAPPLNGLDGSTASTATRRSRARNRLIMAVVRVDFPTPGGPVRPTMTAVRGRPTSAFATSAARAPPASIRLSNRAIARTEPFSAAVEQLFGGQVRAGNHGPNVADGYGVRMTSDPADRAGHHRTERALTRGRRQCTAARHRRARDRPCRYCRPGSRGRDQLPHHGARRRSGPPGDQCRAGCRGSDDLLRGRRPAPVTRTAHPGIDHRALPGPQRPRSAAARLSGSRRPGGCERRPDLAGIRTLFDEPRRGTHGSSINFLHPKDAGGVLIELVQPAE